MKVVHDTYDVLIIEDRPWVFGIFMILFTLLLAWTSMETYADGRHIPGLAFGLSAVVLILVFPLFIRRSMLTLDRVRQRVTLTKRSTRSQTSKTFSLTDFHGAEVLRSKNNDGDEFFYVELFIGGDYIPFTDTASSGDGAAEMAETINAWLQLDSPTPAA